MAIYLIKTDRENKRTCIVSYGEKPELAAYIHTDFIAERGMRDITLEDILNPKKKIIGKVGSWRDGNMISVTSKNEEIAALEPGGRYTDSGKEGRYRVMNKKDLLRQERYADLEEMGLTHGYHFSGGLMKKPPISKILCFEKDGDIAGYVFTQKSDLKIALKALPLVLTERIRPQEFIFRLIAG